jgi:mRNA interferase HigB
MPMVNGLGEISRFIRQHPDSRSSLNSFVSIVSGVNWKSIMDVRRIYPHADAVGTCTVFNIKGNHYHVIAVIDYRAQIIDIKKVLTHAEYDKEKWKKDCGG